MSRIAIVGCEGSGKTALNASVADYFQPGKARGSCTIVPENVAAHKFFDYTQYMMRTERVWPPATSQGATTFMKWSVRIDGSVVDALETVEFGGELFRVAFKNGASAQDSAHAQNELVDFVTKADFIAVVVSIKALMRESESSSDVSVKELERDSETKWAVRELLETALKRSQRRIGVVIALAHSDKYREELAACGGAKALFANRWPTIAALYPGLEVVAVSAVSETTQDGMPADGYSSEGVMPLIRAFAESRFGKIDAIRSDLDKAFAALRDAPDGTGVKAYGQLVQAYSDKVQMLGIVSGFCGDSYADEVLQRVNALVGIEPEIKAKMDSLKAEEKAKAKEAEEKRREREAAERKENEEKRLAREAAAEQLRAESLKRAEDERIRAEKEYAAKKLEAEMVFSKTQAVVKRNWMYAIVAASSMAAVASVCILIYMIDSSRRRSELEAIRVRETYRAAAFARAQELAANAKSGDVDAAREVVSMLDRGEIAEKDIKDIYGIYMLLAEEGDATALFRLGVACHEGKGGVKKSDTNAHWFLSMAKEYGCTSERLDELLELTAVGKRGAQSSKPGADIMDGGGE